MTLLPVRGHAGQPGAGLAALARARAAAELVAGYRLSFLIGAGIAVLAVAAVAASVRRQSAASPAAEPGLTES